MTKKTTMKFKTMLLMTGFLFLNYLTNAQVRFEKTYGGAGFEFAYSVKQTSDNGYILLGSTDSFGAGDRDMYLIKTDEYGETLWTKTYGGMNFDSAFEIDQTIDGGYILSGTKDLQGFLVKTNSSGDTIWTRTFDGIGYSVKQTIDGGYILAGTVFIGAGDYDMFLLKTNSNGEHLWTKKYGGIEVDDCQDVALTSDEGFILAGRSSGEMKLVKTDSNGDTLWTKSYNGLTGYSVKQTSDGGYILLGDSNSSGDESFYMIKTNSSGDTLWTKTYSKGNLNNEGYEIKQTLDNGYIFVGEINNSNSPERKIYLAKTDPFGDTLWTKTYVQGSGNGLDITSDGGYVIVGFTSEIGAGLTDIYLNKSDANGISTNVLNLELNKSFDFSVFPNPFNDFTVLKIKDSNFESLTMRIYNDQGQLVREIKNITSEIVLIEKNSLHSGLYIFQLSTEKQVIANGKLIVE